MKKRKVTKQECCDHGAYARYVDDHTFYQDKELGRVCILRTMTGRFWIDHKTGFPMFEITVYVRRFGNEFGKKPYPGLEYHYQSYTNLDEALKSVYKRYW